MWEPKTFRQLIDKIKVFAGRGAGKPVHPYGEYGDRGRFHNRGEQVVFFYTSGSTGYMQDGKYLDVSGAEITESEYREIMSQAGVALLSDRQGNIKGE